MVSWQDEDAECTEITTDRIVQTNNLDFDQQETNFSESKLSTAVSLGRYGPFYCMYRLFYSRYRPFYGMYRLFYRRYRPFN